MATGGSWHGCSSVFTHQFVQSMLDEPGSTYSCGDCSESGLSSSGLAYCRDGRAQREQVAVHAEAADLAARDGGDHRMRPELLTRMDVRHVQLHDRHCQHRERVAQTVTVVSPGARVDQNGIYVFAECLVDPFAHCAFVVGLKACNLDTEFLAECQQPRVNLRQRGP